VVPVSSPAQVLLLFNAGSHQASGGIGAWLRPGACFIPGKGVRWAASKLDNGLFRPNMVSERQRSGRPSLTVRRFFGNALAGQTYLPQSENFPRKLKAIDAAAIVPKCTSNSGG
jgi:hypothetical protein